MNDTEEREKDRDFARQMRPQAIANGGPRYRQPKGKRQTSGKVTRANDFSGIFYQEEAEQRGGHHDDD
jgi:hypothetical protein